MEKWGGAAHGTRSGLGFFHPAKGGRGAVTAPLSPDFEGHGETIVARHTASAPAEFRTTSDLLAPGDRSLFKI